MWVTLGFVVVVAALGGRYGYHRDELYFIEAGQHPAWGYPDQPALVPLLASAWYDVVGGSLAAFRVLPALAGGTVVAISALTCRELGGSRDDATWSAAVTATATTLLVTAHLFGTTVFDLALTSATVLLLVRAVRTGTPSAWMLAGGAAAAALSVKTLPATVFVCLVLALLLVGPRQPFRSPWAWLAAAVSGLGVVPTLAWQWANGWPQLDLAGSIAAGGSGTSVNRLLLVPMLPTLTGATFVVLVIGAMVLWRQPHTRWLALAVLLLVGVVLLTGGKPYYAFGMVPLLVAAGVPGLRRWAGSLASRRQGLVTAFALNAVGSVALGLPLLPPALAPVDVVYDHGEQVGWPELVSAVAEQSVSGDVEIVLARNYGQAGALDRAARDGHPIPPVFSGHNGYWWWGPPAGEPDRVLTVGRWTARELETWFARCELLGTVHNQAGLANEENGVPTRLCTDPHATWEQMWPSMQRLG